MMKRTKAPKTLKKHGADAYLLYDCLPSFVRKAALCFVLFIFQALLGFAPARAAIPAVLCRQIYASPGPLDIWELATISGLDAMQIQTLSTFSASIQTLSDTVRLGIPEGAFLLGPAGKTYDLLRKNYNLRDFWRAYEFVKLDAFAPQAQGDRLMFLTRLTSQSQVPIYFLIPENFTATRHTAAELQIFLSHPELLEKIHFIYGPENFFGESDPSQAHRSR